MENTKQIRSVKIKSNLNQVNISFVDEIEVDGETDDVTANIFSVKSMHRPHKDFVDAMKNLRKLALDVCGMSVDVKELALWNVGEIKISGDMWMQQSRVVMTLTKQVPRTGKEISFKTPQVTMYPEKDDESRYPKAEELSKKIVTACEEAMKYLGGKYELEGGQLPLFDFVELTI